MAEVVNGQPLQVLEHSQRFLKVKTEKNQIGWIEERAVIDSKTYEGFRPTGRRRIKTTRWQPRPLCDDDLYMHVLPGRETEHFYLLPGNSKVQLLVRASVPKVAVQGPEACSRSRSRQPAQPDKAPATAGGERPVAGKRGSAAAQPQPEAPPPDHGRLVAGARQPGPHRLAAQRSRMDVDVPMDIAQYGEGQRFIGAWVLTNITDPAPRRHRFPSI